MVLIVSIFFFAHHIPSVNINFDTACVRVGTFANSTKCGALKHLKLPT